MIFNNNNKGLNIFPNFEEINNLEFLDLSNNPINSFKTLSQSLILKELILNNTLIENFEGAPNLPNLITISLINTPISNHKTFLIMCLVVFGFQLKEINKIKITNDLIIKSNNLKDLIRPSLISGWILETELPIVLLNLKTNKRIKMSLSDKNNEKNSDLKYHIPPPPLSIEKKNKIKNKNNYKKKEFIFSKPIDETNKSIQTNHIEIIQSQTNNSLPSALKTPVLRKEKELSVIIEQPTSENNLNITQTPNNFPKFTLKEENEQVETLDILETTQNSFYFNHNKTSEELTTLGITINDNLNEKIINNNILNKKKHKDPPLLSISPPPLTFDEDLTLDNIPMTREEAFKIFSQTHKNFITTPEETERFILKLLNKNKK